MKIGTQFKQETPNIVEHYNVSEDVQERLNVLGIVPRTRPVIEKIHEPIFSGMRAGDFFDGRLPVVIRSLTLDQISALHSLFSNWHAYVIYHYKIVLAKLSEAKRRKEFVWASIRQDYLIDPASNKKMPEAQKDSIVTTDPRFVEADSWYAKMLALSECMEAAVSIAEQDLKTISREVTIKQVEIEQMNFRAGSRPPSRFGRE